MKDKKLTPEQEALLMTPLKPFADDEAMRADVAAARAGARMFRLGRCGLLEEWKKRQSLKSLAK